MNVTLDTNILLRHTVGDNAAQAAVAENIFQTAAEIVIPTHVFCEYVWTLRAGYKQDARAIATAIRAIVTTDNVVVDDDEVAAGLQMMDAGGDFADGVNAYAGTRMASGKTVFASFDQKAVRLLNGHGVSAVVPELGGH
jgi:predicted nucleic-acid-binding protein